MPHEKYLLTLDKVFALQSYFEKCMYLYSDAHVLRVLRTSYRSGLHEFYVH
jgi:hypothetical protein